MATAGSDERLRGSKVSRAGGIGLAVAGIAFFASGALHPHGGQGSFRETITEFLHDPMWASAHWLGLASIALLAWVVWVLTDEGWTQESPVARAGGRLTLLGLVIMTVEMAVEIAAGGAAAAYAAGESVPLVDLVDPLQAVGWPALGFGFALLALGARAVAPRWVAMLGAVGGVAMGLGGILVQGLHILPLGPLFAGGNLLALWMVWAGLRIAGARSAEVREPLAASAAR